MKATRRHRHGAVASETHTMSKRLGSLTLHDWRVSPQRCSPSWRRSREDGRTTRRRRASPEHMNHTSQHTTPHRTEMLFILSTTRRYAPETSRRRQSSSVLALTLEDHLGLCRTTVDDPAASPRPASHFFHFVSSVSRHNWPCDRPQLHLNRLITSAFSASLPTDTDRDCSVYTAFTLCDSLTTCLTNCCT